MKRPEFQDIKSGEEFNNWYWLKEEMTEICRFLNLPRIGRKFDLRDRIMYALDNNGKVKSESERLKTKSKFNWAKADLTLKTKITDNVSFGPNFRHFMKNEIGDKFTCHSDFMNWVKNNVGKTLEDAVFVYKQFENRNRRPDFQRKIADQNMFNQYVRDFMKDNPCTSLNTARKFWLIKKQMPTKNGFVKYEKSDFKLLKNNH